MLGKLLGAWAGERIAGPNRRLTGAFVGAAVPAIAKRGIGTLAILAAAGWGAKKLWDRRRGKDAA